MTPERAGPAVPRFRWGVPERGEKRRLDESDRPERERPRERQMPARLERERPSERERYELEQERGRLERQGRRERYPGPRETELWERSEGPDLPGAWVPPQVPRFSRPRRTQERWL